MGAVAQAAKSSATKTHNKGVVRMWTIMPMKCSAVILFGHVLAQEFDVRMAGELGTGKSCYSHWRCWVFHRALSGIREPTASASPASRASDAVAEARYRGSSYATHERVKQW